MKRGGHCRRLEGLRLYMLWDQVMTWSGRRAIWSAAGGLVVGIASELEEGERSTESEDSYSPLSKLLIMLG